jgi:hypothetical protein
MTDMITGSAGGGNDSQSPETHPSGSQAVFREFFLRQLELEGGGGS